MNITAIHFPRSIVSWVEHEEVLLVSLVRKLRNDIDEIADPIGVIGVVALLAYVFLSVLPQLDYYTQLSSCCTVLPLFLGI
jgi:hypothetical protein